MSKFTTDPTRYNKTENEPFDSVLNKYISRRDVLKSGSGIAALSMLSGFGLLGCSDDDNDSDNSGETSVTLGFESIAGSKTDAVVVAAGYTAMVLAPWAEPLKSIASEYKPDGTNSSVDQENAMGMHHDGMYYFPIDGSSTDGLLVVNHEYIDQNALHPNGATRDPDTGLRNDAEEIRKEIFAHGVSVARIQFDGSNWNVVKDDPHNRRFTGATEMVVSGPLENHELLQTKYSPDGSIVRGTLNNCGNGFTPWGTYLTNEENWPGYFVNTGTRTEDQVRIGLDDEDTRYGWDDLAGDPTEVDDEFARFDVTAKGASALEDYRNEANGHGYIVEMDPYDPTSMAVKRTALGRVRHEGCVYGKLVEGQPMTFYTGHDARFEYIYKFVSDAAWDPDDANPSNRLATGAKYMDAGTLYVARFDADGTGAWLPLTLDSVTTTGGMLGDTFSSLAEIILNTAGAADLVGATPMDRPEWGAVDPIDGAVYMTMTNNTRRTETTNAPNPRLNNAYGHIVRWEEGDSLTSFTWDIFVFGSPADGDADTNRSGLSDLNQFASPDGLAFDSRGIMWIQTDNGADAVEEYTNDQMLAVIPKDLTDSSGTKQVINADNQTSLRRFFVGPNGCEVTGICFTPDNTSMFLNIQHPGNFPYDTDATVETPAGMDIRPRATTIVVRKADGGPIGV